MNGHLFLRAAVRDGRTVLLDSRSTYPLHVLRPHAGPDPDAVSITMLLLSGGLLDGDHLSIEVFLEAGARLAMRTQAASQVHAGVSYQTLHARVAEDAWFSYVPQAVVPHAGAEYLGAIEVHMDAGARVLLAESLSPGRVEHGEFFDYARVQTHLDVWLDGILVARERAVLLPGVAPRGAVFGPFSHTAGVYALGPGRAPCLDVARVRLTGTQLARARGWYVRAMAQRAADLDAALAHLSSTWWQHASDSTASAQRSPRCAATVYVRATRTARRPRDR